jgi:cytochrome c biogenesis protein CcdA
MALVVLLLLPSLFAGLAAAQSNESAVARLILFYSPTCPHCHYVLEEVLPPLREQYGAQLEVRLYNISEEDGYSVYAALHQYQPDLPTGVPKGYIGGYVLVGSVEFETGLPSIIDTCLADGGCDWAFSADVPEQSQIADPAPDSGSAEPIFLAFSYDATCLECDAVSYELEHLQRKHPNLEVRYFDVRQDAALIEAMCERFDVPSDERLLAPAIFVGDQYLSPDVLASGLPGDFIEVAGDDARIAPWEGLDEAELSSATERVVERFAGFSAVTVAAAGLLDGVNPCAFTTIIFFVSYLALVGRKGKEILLVGAAFALAVFLTYVVMGLGLAALLENLGGVSLIGRLIYGVTAIICLGLAIFSLWDYIKIRRGQLTEIALQLPKALKKRIHSTIRKRSRMRGFIGAAFVAGILVSVFELACTGQVYLPTIVFMTGVAEMRLTAILYLLLYNLMFVVPLIAVFVVTYLGTGGDRLTALFQQNVGAVKLFTVGLFSFFGIWLIYMVLAV